MDDLAQNKLSIVDHFGDIKDYRDVFDIYEALALKNNCFRTSS